MINEIEKMLDAMPSYPQTVINISLTTIDRKEARVHLVDTEDLEHLAQEFNEEIKTRPHTHGVTRLYFHHGNIEFFKLDDTELIKEFEAI